MAIFPSLSSFGRYRGIDNTMMKLPTIQNKSCFVVDESVVRNNIGVADPGILLSRLWDGQQVTMIYSADNVHSSF